MLFVLFFFFVGNNLQNAEKLKSNDKAERGETHRNLGIVYQNSSDFHEAIEYHECHLQTAKVGGGIKLDKNGLMEILAMT